MHGRAMMILVSKSFLQNQKIKTSLKASECDHTLRAYPKLATFFQHVLFILLLIVAFFAVGTMDYADAVRAENAGKVNQLSLGE